MLVQQAIGDAALRLPGVDPLIIPLAAFSPHGRSRQLRTLLNIEHRGQ
ncbi:hypothetical protein [Arthrobacter sp. UYEF3]